MLNHSLKGNFFILGGFLKWFEGWTKMKGIFFGFTFFWQSKSRVGRYLVTYFGCYIPLQKGMGASDNFEQSGILQIVYS